MQNRRTDVYFVGLPGTGKSTMLAGLLYNAYEDGILISDTSSKQGYLYQNYIVDKLENGVLPHPTEKGSFNYIALDLKDIDGRSHPFNMVEVPGELFEKIIDNPDIDSFIHYIKNQNKKILIFTIDSLVHLNKNKYLKTRRHNQRLVYGNLIDIFKRNGVLEKTDAIYIVANKFDALKQIRYKNDNRPDIKLADDFIQNDFSGFFAQCVNAKKLSRNEFKIRMIPFSIGEVVYTYILKRNEKKYSDYLIKKLIEDSFIIDKKSKFW
jgi:GTPase SAR1 family protein